MGSLVVQDIEVDESDKEMVGRETLGIDAMVEVPRTRMEPQTNFPRRRPHSASVPNSDLLDEEKSFRPLLHPPMSPDITSTSSAKFPPNDTQPTTSSSALDTFISQ